MAETQHTPGPWTYDDKDGTINAHGGVVAETAHSDYTTRQDRENARLIVAAPEMLAALKAVDALGMLNPTGSGFVEDAARAIKAAIFKAEGRS